MNYLVIAKIHGDSHISFTVNCSTTNNAIFKVMEYCDGNGYFIKEIKVVELLNGQLPIALNYMVKYKESGGFTITTSHDSEKEAEQYIEEQLEFTQENSSIEGKRTDFDYTTKLQWNDEEYATWERLWK